MAEDLGYAELRNMATRLRVDMDIWEELYPMVHDLLAIAHQLEELVPELHAELELPGHSEEAGSQ